MGSRRVSIRISVDKKRLLELERFLNPECNSIEDVLDHKIDFREIEKRFKKLMV